MSNHENLQALMHNANFQMLEQVVSERNNAIVNHKTKEHAVKQAAYTHMSNTLKRMQDNASFQARQQTEHKTGESKAQSGFGASAPKSSGKTESGNNAFGAKGSSDNQSASSNPANWPNIQGSSDSYNQAMFNYFMLSISGDMNNPNAMFDFLESLIKMLGDNNPLVKQQMAAFTAALAKATSPNPITGKMSNPPGSYAKALATIMAAVAIYNAQKNGGSATAILNKMKNALGGGSGNPFISQILSALGNTSGLISNVEAQIKTTYGTDTIDTNILSFMMENVALNSKGLGTAVEDYKTGYMKMLIERNFEERKQKGANALELLQFLIGVVCGQQNDQIGSFSVTIDALSAPGSALGSIKGDIAPEEDSSKYNWQPSQSYDEKIYGKLKNLMSELQKLQEYENSPIMKNNKVASSIKAAIKSVLGISATYFDNRDGNSYTVTLGQLLYHSGINWKNPTKDQLQILGSWFDNMSRPQSDSGTEKVNQSYEDAVNALAVPEQKISGINDMEKTLFTNANQQASQSLSTVGGIIKDQMKLFSLMVQNQKA